MDVLRSKTFWLYAIVIFGIIYFYDKAGTFQVNTAMFWGGSLIMLFTLAGLGVLAAKYHTSQIVVDDRHFSHCVTHEWTCGDHVLYSLGDVPLLLMYGTEGVLITHRSNHNRLGTQTIANNQTLPWPEEFLAPDIRHFVQQNEIKGPYYIGDFSVLHRDYLDSLLKSDLECLKSSFKTSAARNFLTDISEVRQPNIEYLINLSLWLSQEVSHLEDRLHGKLRHFEDELAVAGNAVHTLDKGPSILDRVLHRDSSASSNNPR